MYRVKLTIEINRIKLIKIHLLLFLPLMML